VRGDRSAACYCRNGFCREVAEAAWCGLAAKLTTCEIFGILKQHAFGSWVLICSISNCRRGGVVAVHSPTKLASNSIFLN